MIFNRPSSGRKNTNRQGIGFANQLASMVVDARSPMTGIEVGPRAYSPFEPEPELDDERGWLPPWLDDIGDGKGEKAGPIVGVPVGESGEEKESEPAPGESKKDMLDRMFEEYIKSLDSQTGEGRQALDDQMKQEAVEAQFQQEAKAGAAGMGLTGATQSIQGGLSAQLARQRALALDQFDRSGRAEKLAGIESFGNYITEQDKAKLDGLLTAVELAELESELGKDLDGDGNIADQTKEEFDEENPEPEEPEEVPEGQEGQTKIVPQGGGSAKYISEMSQSEFNKCSKEQIEAQGWKQSRAINAEGGEAVGGFGAVAVVWIGPNGEEQIATLDDAGEWLSGGLEWDNT